MTRKNHLIESTGTYKGLFIVGFNGILGSDQTPARRQPVIADDDGNLVIVTCGSDICISVSTGICEKDDSWTDTGTRISGHRWPFRKDDISFIISRREVEAIYEYPIKLPEYLSSRSRVLEFLGWLKSGESHSNSLRSIWIGNLVIWYEDAPTIESLRWIIAERVRFKFKQSALRPESDAQDILSKSFWLSRAANSNDDVAMASAGLRFVGSPFWESVFDSGITFDSRKQKDEMIDCATKEYFSSATPIEMLLCCPSCGERHIDEGEFAVKVHHTHACQYCGMVWRPAIRPTIGVRFLPGFKNK